jgi:putative flippase GtrA
MALISSVSSSVARVIRTKFGKRFGRFALAAIVSAGTSEVTLLACYGIFKLAPGRSSVAAWLAGAIVSYFMTRWTWERKGRPNLLKETLPFWAISACTIVILVTATKLAHSAAHTMNLSNAERVIFVAAAYFGANCLTFVTRFVIFHYVLFADRGSKEASPGSPVAAPGTGEVPLADELALAADPAPFALATGPAAGRGPVTGGTAAETEPRR